MQLNALVASASVSARMRASAQGPASCVLGAPEAWGAGAIDFQIGRALEARRIASQVGKEYFLVREEYDKHSTWVVACV
jgi:hypothetical protein